MHYWKQILSEVINKHDPQHPTLFTNVRECLSQPEGNADEIKPTIKRQSVPKQTTRKQPKAKACGRTTKYRLGDKFPHIYFTKREAQVAFCCIQGKSTLQIAALFNLSRRTVEFYINNMKVKLNCRFKSELIRLIAQSDLSTLADVSVDISHQG